MWKIIGTVGLALVLFATSCADGGADRGDVLGDLAEKGIVVEYAELVTDAELLQAAIEDLCAEADQQSAQAAQDALAAARGSWLDTEAMWIGPVMDLRSWTVIDWPIDAEQIEALIADETTEIDSELLGKRVGADQRGLGAIEYLLLGATPTEALSTAANGRRCDYLLGASIAIVDEATRIEAAWVDGVDGQPPYVETFTDDESATMETLVNDALVLIEDMADGELGAALGDTEGEADLDAIVEGPGGYGVTDLEHRLHGLEVVFIGSADQDGLLPLLDQETEQQLIGDFNDAAVAIEALEPPLRDAVIQTPDDVHEVYEALEALQVTISTEVVSELGVTVDASDADGDSSG